MLTGPDAVGWVLPPVVRRGEPVCPGREAGRRASAAGPWMAHRRVPWDKGVNRGHPTEEGEQVGEKTFGDFGSFQSHSPSRAAAAKPRRGRSPRVLHGEAVPIRLVTPHPSPLPQGERGRLLWCNALCLLHPTVLPQGERGWLPWCNALCLLHPIVLPHGERGSLLRLEARPGLLTHRGWNPRTLPQARDAGLVSAEAWEFGQIPSLPPLAVATTMRR